MKKITLLAFLLGAGLSGFSQISFEASENYGKLMNLTYDATVQNRIYAATQGNHIVVSNDNGATWSLFYSHPTGSFLEDLKFAPGNTELTFTTGNQLHFLSLATQQITHSIPVPQSNVAGAGMSYYSSYSIYDAAGETILADTGFSIGFASQGKTFYTENGGEDWSEVYYTADNDNIFVNNVAISPVSPKKLFLARGNGDTDADGGLWISDNEGVDWTEHIAGIPVDVITFNPSDATDIFVGTGISFGEYPENLYRSNNDGTSWNVVPITWAPQSLDNITAIVFNPVNTNKIILLEENEIARSNDNGATWTTTVYEAGVAMDYYYGIAASYNPFNDSQIAITTDLFPQSTTDAGVTLTQIKAKFHRIPSVSAAVYSDVSHLYYSSNGGRFHKNLNTNVTTASDVENPDSFNPKSNYMIADPAIPGRVFTYASMGFFGGNVNVSTDYGTTTTNILPAFADDIQELAIDPNNSNIIYVSLRSGESSTVTKVDITDLENIVTTDITTPELNEFGEGVTTGIVINPANSNEIYIAKQTKIFKSIDGGLTWVQKSSGLEDITQNVDLIWDMQANPLNPAQMTVASNIGIFTTTDYAENWTQVLSNTDVRSIKHSPLNDNVIVGSIHANVNELSSIVYSVNNGTTWTTVSAEDLDHLQSYDMDYLFEGNTIHAFLATTDLGVVKYDILNLPLAVNDPGFDNSFGIYPNPASAQVNVFSGNNEIQSVSVFSLTGQKVLESHAAAFDVSPLSNGIYLVKATTVDGKSATQKLVKK